MIKKTLRFIGRGLLLLVALVLVWWLVLILRGEWVARTVKPLPPPPVTVAAGDAPVLILLHGAGLNGHMWDPMRRGLDPRWRVIAPDLPGQGAREAEHFTLEGAVATVLAAAQAVAPAPVVLVGDSLGGYTAMAAASALPKEQLRGLVIGGSSANFQPLHVFNYAGSLLMVSAFTTLMDEREILRTGMPKFGVSDEDAKPMLAAGANMHVVPEAVRALMGVDFKAKLAAIPQPVLIFNGTLDTNAMAGEPDFLAVAQHGSSFHFENTEHGISMRKPTELARLVNGFAEQVFAKP